MSLDQSARAPGFGARTFLAVLCHAFTIVAALTVAPAVFAGDADTRPLSLNEAVRLAEDDSPAITARKSAVESAEDAVAPAGALPDPQLVAGIDNLPVTTGDAFNVTRDFMTMRKIGVMQNFPQREKRRSRAGRLPGHPPARHHTRGQAPAADGA